MTIPINYVNDGSLNTFNQPAHPDNRSLSGSDSVWRIDPVRFRMLRQGAVIVVEPAVHAGGQVELNVWILPVSANAVVFLGINCYGWRHWRRTRELESHNPECTNRPCRCGRFA